MNDAEQPKVVNLKERLSEGAYSVDPRNVADAILRRPLLWTLLGLQRVFVARERPVEPGKCNSGSC